MIIQEVNQIEKKRKEIDIIKFTLSDFKLPNPYHIEETSDSLSIVEGKIFKGAVAELKLKDDVIEVYFTDEEDLEFLREYFKDSNTKFKLILGDFYY